jgi:hypothetical protein
MKSFFQTLTLSFVTASSLTLYLAPQSLAITANPVTNTTIYRPEMELETSQLSTEEKLLADGTYCESWGNYYGRVVTCCVDSYGNKACVY